MTDKEKQEREDSDLKRVLECDFGRRFVRRVLATCGVFRSNLGDYFPGVRPEDRVLVNAARQDLGLWLLDESSRVNAVGVQAMTGEASRKMIADVSRFICSN